MQLSIEKFFKYLAIAGFIIPFAIISLIITGMYKNRLVDQQIDKQVRVNESLKKTVLDEQVRDCESVLLKYTEDLDVLSEEQLQDIIPILKGEWNILRVLLPANAVFSLIRGGLRYEISSSGTDSVLFDQQIPYISGTDFPDDRVSWSIPYQSIYTREIILTAVVPLKSPEPSLLALDIPMKEFVSRFKEETEQKGEKFLVLLSGDEVINLNRKLNEPVEYSSLYDWELLLDKKNSVHQIGLLGKRYYILTTYLESMDFYLASLIPYRIVLLEIIPAMAVNGIILILSFILIYWGIKKVTGRISSNVRLMNDYMAAIERGNYQIRNCTTEVTEFLTLNRSLNSLVETLASNITDLEKGNRELADQTELKTILLHMISHNASTPVTILLNTAYEKLEDEDNEEIRQMYIAAGNLRTLMENIMVLLKLEEGFSGLQEEIINLNDLTRDVCQMYEPLLARKDLAFDLDLPDLFWKGNYFLGKVLLENLIENALKYSFHGGTVSICCENTGEEVRWTIFDNGPGFSREDRKMAFTRFKTLSARPTGGESSSGIGLFLVKQIMLRCGGNIRILPEEDHSGGAIELLFPGAYAET